MSNANEEKKEEIAKKGDDKKLFSDELLEEDFEAEQELDNLPI